MLYFTYTNEVLVLLVKLGYKATQRKNSSFYFIVLRIKASISSRDKTK
jgi:hypothetical protein